MAVVLKIEDVYPFSKRILIQFGRGDNKYTYKIAITVLTWFFKSLRMKSLLLAAILKGSFKEMDFKLDLEKHAKC